MEFLRELVKARSAPVLNYQKHLKTMSLDGDTVGTLLVSDASAGDVVLRVQRIDLDPHPRIPSILRGRVGGDPNNSASVPTLLSGDVDVDLVFNRWILAWKAWAADDRVRRPLWHLREGLLWALQEVQSRPESIEVVVAAGKLRLPEWNVDVHVVSQPAVIERDDHSGDVLLRFEDESSPRLEDTQLFTAAPYFDGTGSRAMGEALVESVFSPIDPAIDGVLKQWASRAISVRVPFGPTADVALDDARLDRAPAIIVRRRGDHALLDYYERILLSLQKDGAEVPLGLAQLIEAFEPEERVAALGSSASSAASFAEPPLFPLPANEEQGQIIDRLAGDSGVVVEGPPGTGKTHTIANLVSSLLARGQRVLVTSEKAQALRVLKDKMPPEMQELCISVTSGSASEKSELKKSINEIASRKSSFNLSVSQRRIDDLVTLRTQALSRRSVILADIHSAREAETLTHSHVATGYVGTTAAIVQRVNGLRDLYEWMPSPLTNRECPLAQGELAELVELSASRTTSRSRRIDENLPDVSGLLPHADVLRGWCEALGEPDSPDGLVGNRAAMHLLVEGADAKALEELREGCIRLEDALIPVRNAGPRASATAGEVLSGRNEYLWSKTSELASLLAQAAAADREVGAMQIHAPVVGPQAATAYAALAQALAAGEPWRGRFMKSSAQRAVEALGVIATVDAVEATTAPAAHAVARHLSALESLRFAESIVADLGFQCDWTLDRSARINNLRNVIRDIDHINHLVETVHAFENRLRALRLAPLRLTDIQSIEAAVESMSAIVVAQRKRDARQHLDDLASALGAILGESGAAEGEALRSAIAVGTARAVEDSRNAYRVARSEQAVERRFVALRDRLAVANPELARLIASMTDVELWRDRISEVPLAWSWSQANGWVVNEIGRLAADSLEAQLDAVEREISLRTSQLAAAQAWHSCMQQTTAAHQQSLQAYRDHIANVGKGTGKHAERYRVAAREAMREAQGAVPAWVMPIKEVLASIPPRPNSFDVVIVDEASQVDITGIFLLSLAPRVIVVGDDMQCAPSEVTNGALDPIFRRLDNYLADVPMYLRQGFTPRSSIFTLLRSRFGTVIRLREHFRCMPEIINWSSNQFYRDAPLVPVRQYGADRLPPLRTVLVADGFTEGTYASIRNVPEAEAIVKQIELCISDPAYKDKTMGVVVLQGAAQIDIINNELLRRIDPDERERRRIRVGNPPDFQGDERHVIFLSLVVGQNTRFAAQTRTEMQRRYNVAASRAQDQLWLFHSVNAARLKPTDLRASLLHYMESTSPVAAPPMPENVTRDDRHEMFDSLFEQRIFLEIVARGYHVNPQVEVNGRRIDLVVTGSRGKLAVECDGDAWHSSPEQQRADLDREQELRRCGWMFWRIRESAYYLDPEKALAGLWASLDSLGISPGGTDLSTASTPSETTWSPVELPRGEEEDLLARDLDDAASSEIVDVDEMSLGTRWLTGEPAAAMERLIVAPVPAPQNPVQQPVEAEPNPLASAEVRSEPTPLVKEQAPLGAWEFVADAEVPVRATVPQPKSKAVPRSERDPESVRRLLMAAAWHREVTLPRAMSISQMDEERTVELLEAAERDGQLRTKTTKHGKTWVRAPR